MSKDKEIKARKPLSIKVYSELCWKRYSGMSKKEKMNFLEALSRDCQCSRQHARRVMGRAVASEGFGRPKLKRGRKSIYADDDELIRWLQEFWCRLNYPNTKVFPQMLAEWMPYFDQGELPELIRKKILVMSGSTMEKLLRSYKREHGKKHFAATKNKGRLKKMLVRVPERRLDFKITSPKPMAGLTRKTIRHAWSKVTGRKSGRALAMREWKSRR